MAYGPSLDLYKKLMEEYMKTHGLYNVLYDTDLDGIIDKIKLPPIPKGPTVIVAASDSKNKENADYICDGVDDQEEIMEAINSLPDSGGIVLLKEGTYVISSTIEIKRSNVVLSGVGPATKIFLADGAGCDIIKIWNDSASLENVIVRDLQVDGNKANQTAGGRGIWFYGTSDYPFKNCGVINCYVHDIYGSYDSIYFNYTEHAFVVNNFVENSGIGIGVIASSHYSVILGNRVSSCSDIGIRMASSNYCTAMGNIVHDCESHGIYLSNISYSSIVGNISYLNKSGIYVTYGSYIVIANNACISNSEEGIRVANNPTRVVVGNVCYHNDKDGIYFAGNNSIIVGNICRYNNVGISVLGDNNLIGKNILTNNTAASYSDTGSGNIWGVYDTTNNIDNVV